MAGTILKIKQSALPGKIPSGESLVQGELALNTADHKLYSKDSAGVVFEVTTSANAIFPLQEDNANKFLMTNGTITQWETIDTLSQLDGGYAMSVFGDGDLTFDGGTA
jgi:hypothetical protein